jgi:hypothetical protein
MFEAFLQSLQATAIATAIREDAVLFPWIECVHVLALTLVIGFIVIVDLRLIGIASRERTVRQVTAGALPFTWSAFGVAAITGGLLFSSNAVTYAHNFYFQAKMVFLALAGINMLTYHLFLGRGAEQWGSAVHPPLRARIAGAVSLLLWIGIVTFGRWIGFTIVAH